MDILKKVFSRRDSIIVITVLLLLAKVLGFVKIRIYADLFDVSRELDLFWAAFLIPDTAFNILIGGSVNAAIIPVFSSTLHKRGEERLVKLFMSTTVAMFIITAITTIILYIFASDLSQFLINSGYATTLTTVRSDFTEQDVLTLSKLMRIMLLSPLLLSVSSIITAFLQVHKRFFITTLAPLLYNLGIVLASPILVSKYGMGNEGLAWAVVLGCVLQVVIQVPVLIEFIVVHLKIKEIAALGGRTRYYLNEMRQIVVLAVPRVIAYAGEQFNAVINTVISFTLTTGALSAYRFAFSIHLLPVHIFGSAIAQLALPRFSELYARDDHAGFKRVFDKSLREMLFLILPSTVALVVLRIPIVRVVFSLDDWDKTIITAWCLALLGLGIIGQSVASIGLRALYAIHETRLPLLVTFITICINLLGSYFFTNFFSHYVDWRDILNQIFLQLSSSVDVQSSATLTETLLSFWNDLGRWFTTRNVQDFAIGGLALSLSVTFLAEMALYLYVLHKKYKVLSWSETFKPLWVITQNSAFMFLTTYFVYRVGDFYLDTSRTLYVLCLIVFSAGWGGVVYMLISLYRNVEEAHGVWNRILKYSSRVRYVINSRYTS